MKSIWHWVSSREGRKRIYTISLTFIPILVFYGAINEQAAPLWIALVGSIVSPVMALTHLTPKE